MRIPFVVAVLLLIVLRTSLAQIVSVDFNTFVLRGEEAEMLGADETYGAGGVWNQMEIPHENIGHVLVTGLKDSDGNPTQVSLQLEGPSIKSWWSTKRLMPMSKLYRDYVAMAKPTKLTISGLLPNTKYRLAVFGYPLGWAQVELSLNGRSMHVLSGSEWAERQRTAGVLETQTDETGTLSGTVKGMWAGFHVGTCGFTQNSDTVVMSEGDVEREKPPTFPPSNSISYKSVGGTDLYLDVYLPEGHEATDRRPAIIFFHGGSWSRGWKTQFSPQCHYLASRGMVAITAAYRVTGRPPESTSADCVRDAKSAVRWVRKHANMLGVNPAKIAAGGGSAGGHLAAATAYLSEYNEAGEDATISHQPGALVLFNPVIDNSPGGGYPFGPKPITETWRSWSPMHNITAEKAVPTIFFLGEEDHLIPVTTGEEYIRRTIEAGADGALFVYPGAKHGFFNGGDALLSTLEQMDAFLTKHGFLEIPHAPTKEVGQ